MARNSIKHGLAGVSNAASKPYRLVGGTHENPRHFTPETAAAKHTQPSAFQNYGPYHIGMIGGLMAARLGFGFPGSKELEKELLG